MIVQTDQGAYRGLAGAVDRYLGIRFAAPPTGSRRWRLPQPPEPHGGVMDAMLFGDDCPQAASPYTRAGGQSEDCLSLNVWTPHDRANRGLPVLLWLPGGGFVGGSASDVRTDGAALAKRGIVVVTANYRVGMFGYFAHPALTEDGGGASGNYGLHDSAIALAWVRRNIAAFGGDPDRITLGGVSAGGAQAALLMTAPPALVLPPSQLLLQSPGTMRPLAMLAEAERDGAALARDVDRLRRLSPADLLRLAGHYTSRPRSLTRARTLRPIIDGALLRRDEREAHRTGAFVAVPALVGSTLDEGTQFAAKLNIHTSSAFRAFLDREFGDGADEASALYPAHTDREVGPALAAVYGDTQFTYGATALTASLARHTRVWRYLFSSFGDECKESPCHGQDVAFTFGVDAFVDGIKARPGGEAADAIATIASDHWARFIEFGDPGWPACDRQAQPLYAISGDSRLRYEWRDRQMTFLDRYFAQEAAASDRAAPFTFLD